MDRLNAFKPTSPRIWTALGLLVLPVLFLSGISFFLLLEKRPRIQAAISTLSFIAYDRDSIDRNLTSLAFFPPRKTSPSVNPVALSDICSRYGRMRSTSCPVRDFCPVAKS